MLEKIRAFFKKEKSDGRTAAALGGALLLIICVLIGVVASVTTESCSRSGITGTWVLREDYYNGFDFDDMYVEFRNDGSFFVNGSHKGYLVIDGKKRGISTVPDMNYLSKAADKVRMENNLLIIEGQSNRLFDFSSPDAWRLQVYIRISGDCELTQEQRAVLY